MDSRPLPKKKKENRVKPVRHVPQRTCAGCKKVLPKRELIRIVRSPDGVVIDPTGKIAGRGVYLHNKFSCWQQGKKGAVARALKVQLTDHEIELLQTFASNLPEDDTEESRPD